MDCDHDPLLLDEAVKWRRDLHRIPELLYDLPLTAEYIAKKLRSFGVDEIAERVGRTGVVSIIRGMAPGPTIAMRADMDALPIHENTQLPYRSTFTGRMHACGHDGHMAMLLGAAKVLCEQRKFRGSIALVFQPAEEGGAGARAMIDDGLFERFSISEIYGMHNLPGLAAGQFATRVGPLMAAADTFDIRIHGSGGHAARPEETRDPLVTACHIALGLQTIVSRNVDPLDSAVVSVTGIETNDSYTVIDSTCSMKGTTRTLSIGARDLIEQRLREIANSMASAYQARAEILYERCYPVLCNHREETQHAIDAAVAVAGIEGVSTDCRPIMAAEDFAFMLERCPGAFVFIGNGSSRPLHHSAYEFNDHIIAAGVSYWRNLATHRLGVDV